ncbi:MAG: hypothetical protein LBK25_03530 [Treponema sp.]|nr:hypothetical protein [Treponema sp.]
MNHCADKMNRYANKMSRYADKMNRYAYKMNRYAYKMNRYAVSGTGLFGVVSDIRPACTPPAAANTVASPAHLSSFSPCEALDV